MEWPLIVRREAYDSALSSYDKRLVGQWITMSAK